MSLHGPLHCAEQRERAHIRSVHALSRQGVAAHPGVEVPQELLGRRGRLRVVASWERTRESEMEAFLEAANSRPDRALDGLRLTRHPVHETVRGQGCVPEARHAAVLLAIHVRRHLAPPQVVDALTLLAEGSLVRVRDLVAFHPRAVVVLDPRPYALNSSVRTRAQTVPELVGALGAVQKPNGELLF